MTMNRMRMPVKRVATFALTTVMALSLVASASITVDAAKSEKAKPSKLGPHDLDLIAAARARGESTITLLIASSRGRNSSVAGAVSGLGGDIRYREDSVDYLRTKIASDATERVAALAGVEAVDVDEIIPLDDPRPGNIVAVIPQTAPGASTPNDNPYMPTRDTKASQFVAAHPTWDGRGITIGIVDTGVSLDHPSLLTTSTGERKIVNWVTGTDPRDDPDPTWVNMSLQVNVVGGAFTTGSGATAVNYTGVAADGTYRFGTFFEGAPTFGGAPGSEFSIDCDPSPTVTTLGGDLNRNGVCNERFGILWRTTENMVWVDTNADRNFSGAAPMTDYSVNFDIGEFGTDRDTTPVRDVVPFVVQTDGKNKFVNIGIASGAHASHVAGIAAGNSLFGGDVTGAAPGAKIVSSRACLFVAGCTSHALVEGMIFVAQQANVDVINMSIGGLPALNDGNNTRARIYDRLIEQSNVQMFISAGNSGPGINTIGDPSVATKVVSVGASITRDSYLSNYGADPVYADNLLYFSSRGPREDGGFKPNIVAPGSAVSTTPLWQAGGPVSGTYTLPPGYSMFNGTSMASPMAAGSAALLLNAAKESGVQHQPAQVRQAINSSARWLDDPARFQAYDQGNGLMDVEAAWNVLRTNIATAEISSSVQVNTLLSDFLATPGVGVGIHDREGVDVGESYTRTYTFRRTSGSGGTTRYNLSWVGNDGTFSTSATSIALPKNTPVNLVVNINPAAAGAHAAILNLNDPATAGIEYQTMNLVIAPFEFNAGNNYDELITGTIERAQTKHYFFRVPASTPALKVDLGGPSLTAGTGAARFIRWHPWGLGIDSNAVSNCYSGQPGGTCGTGSATSRAATNPQAGVWEVSVDARRNSDATAASFSLTGAILGASVSPNPDVIESATIGTPVARSYTLTNLFGAFTGRATGSSVASTQTGPLGSAFRDRPSIGHLEQQFRAVAIPAGATSLRATIGSPSDPAADLDLFVYNCTTATSSGTSIVGCGLAGQNADGDSEESVTITNPAEGRWVVFVDGFAVPQGTTEYNYIDVFLTTAPQGTIMITDANALRPAGSTWTVPGSLTANVVPAEGRVLYGTVQVRTDANVLVGSGDVIIETVTP
jgi:hypothetical protein